jgi:hypothetical protein
MQVRRTVGVMRFEIKKRQGRNRKIIAPYEIKAPRTKKSRTPKNQLLGEVAMARAPLQIRGTGKGAKISAFQVNFIDSVPSRSATWLVASAAA